LQTSASIFERYGVPIDRSDQTVTFEFVSEVSGGPLVPHGPAYQKLIPGHQGYDLPATRALEQMSRAYLEEKFASVNPDAPTTIRVVLRSFEIQEMKHTSDPGWTTGARSTAHVEIMRGGQVLASKMLESKATSTEVDGTAEKLMIGSINSVNEATVAKLHGFLRDSPAI
jgi:hypothetical protein